MQSCFKTAHDKDEGKIIKRTSIYDLTKHQQKENNFKIDVCYSLVLEEFLFIQHEALCRGLTD